MIKYFFITVIFLFLVSFSGNKRQSPEMYEITELGSIIDNLNQKEDSIKIFLSISKKTKYYNSYWLLESQSGNTAKMRIHYSGEHERFKLDCFHAYKEGNSVSYHFKGTKIEDFIYSVLGNEISKIQETNGRYRCEYSFYDKDSVLCKSYFIMTVVR